MYNGLKSELEDLQMTEQQLQALLLDLSLEEKAFQLTQAPPSYYLKDVQLAGSEVNAELTDRELALMGSVLYVNRGHFANI